MSLTCTGVNAIRQQRHLLKDVSFCVNSGELVGLVGPNGAGKSTLLSLLGGLMPPEQGLISLDGVDYQQLAARERGQRIAWLAQSGEVNWPLSVERVVALGRRPHLSRWQSLSSQDNAAIDAAIHQCDCESIRYQSAATLSGGERCRMLLARALAASPDYLLADEPVAALDLSHQLQTMQLLRQFTESGNGCLVVLHDLSLALRFCTRLILLHQGRIVADDLPAAVLSDENIEYVYNVSVARGNGTVPWVVPDKVLPALRR